MSNPVAQVTAAPTKVISFARNNVIAFVFLFLVLFWVFIRYGARIRGFLAGLPVVGPYLAKIFVAMLVIGGAAAVGVDVFNTGVIGAGAFACYPFDLKSDGKTQATLTPATSEQNVTFLIDGAKTAVGGDKWPKAARLVGRVRFGIDQAAMGGAVINYDQLPRVIAGLRIQSPCFGEILAKEEGSGPILKHLIDFVGNGYWDAQPARAQLAAADGDTAMDLYFSYPFAPAWMYRPEDCAPWIGLLHDTKVTFYLNTTTCFDAVSTGAVIEATTNLQMWIDYFVAPKFELPNIAEWKLYRQAAAGGKSIKLQGVGTSSGISASQPFDLLAGVYQLSDQLGLGGPDGIDNITSVECPQLGLDSTENVDAFIYQFRALIGRRPGPINSNHATNAGHDGAGGYEGITATPNATLNTSTAKFLPLLTPAMGQKITRCPKFAGNLEIKENFTSPPSSGEHRFVVHSIRLPDMNLRNDMLRRAGRPPVGQAGLLPATQNAPKLLAEAQRDRGVAEQLRRFPVEVR